MAQSAQAYALLCIAEAQSLTVLRAIQKGNAPSLIASLAVDAAAAFDSAAGTARGVAAAKSDSKFALYADYQAAVHWAYGRSFAGTRIRLLSGPAEERRRPPYAALTCSLPCRLGAAEGAAGWCCAEASGGREGVIGGRAGSEQGV